MLIVKGGAAPLKLPEGDCVLNTREGVCLTSREKAVELLKKFLVKYGSEEPVDTANEAVKQAMKMLKVNKEVEIWEHPRVRWELGAKLAKEIQDTYYKPVGPADCTDLLDNENIDHTLEQWSLHSEKLFGKKFLHVPFQMIDFLKTGSELARLDLGEVSGRFDCFGVVLNTDVSTGRGKHWFCVYGDFTPKGTRTDPYTLEYFNSSGNAPLNQVAIWLENSSHALLKYHKKHCEVVTSAPRRLQNSQTECGMWSLLYIRSRLEGKPHNWFYTVKATDQDMINSRAKLFRRD